MAYNPFPVSYQPYPSLYQPPQTQPNNGLNWVQGESGAKSYLVAPNTTVLLMDSENEVFYLKSSDASGMPQLRIFDYKERVKSTEPEPAPVKTDEYVTKDEFQAFKNEIQDIIGYQKIDTKPEKKGAKNG